MDFAQQQRNPAKHIVGIVFVVIFHVLLVYALINGLASRVVDAIKKPVEVKIVEEVKPPPPPPPNLPPPPKLTAPPPPFIPPPEVQINTPPPPVYIPPSPAPPAAVDYSKQNTAINAPSAPPAPPAPKNVHTVCPNVATVQSSTPYPRAAMKAGIQEGTATARFTVHADGSISDITVSASNHYFAETATQMVQQLKCTGTGSDLTVTFPIGFKLED